MEDKLNLTLDYLSLADKQIKVQRVNGSWEMILIISLRCTLLPIEILGIMQDIYLKKSCRVEKRRGISNQ